MRGSGVEPPVVLPLPPYQQKTYKNIVSKVTVDSSPLTNRRRLPTTPPNSLLLFTI